MQYSQAVAVTVGEQGPPVRSRHVRCGAGRSHRHRRQARPAGPLRPPSREGLSLRAALRARRSRRRRHGERGLHRRVASGRAVRAPLARFRPGCWRSPATRRCRRFAAARTSSSTRKLRNSSRIRRTIPEVTMQKQERSEILRVVPGAAVAGAPRDHRPRLLPRAVDRRGFRDHRRAGQHREDPHVLCPQADRRDDGGARHRARRDLSWPESPIPRSPFRPDQNQMRCPQRGAPHAL